MTAIEHACAVAQELTPEERIQLANMLLDEVEPAPEEAPEGWWGSIEPEVNRRIAAIDSGEAKTYSLAEVRRRIADRFNGTRDSLL